MKKLTLTFIALAVLLGGLAWAPQYAHAADSPSDQIKTGVDAIGGNKGGNATPITSLAKTITNTLLFVIGAVAVVMIVIGGFRYVTSNGEAAQVQAAKNTIMYAVIGIIVSLMAYAIVNYVINRMTSTPSSGHGTTTSPGTDKTPS